MWCDGFDLDLPRIVKESKEALGELADLTLHTYSHVTGGKINCPSAWNEHEGLVSYFGFNGPWLPNGRTPMAPAVQCTLWEAVRDLWVHQHILCLEGVHVWDPSPHSQVGQAFEVLMYESRGWMPVSSSDVNTNCSVVLASLQHLAEKVREMIPKVVK